MSQDTLDVVSEAPNNLETDWDQYQETAKMLNLAVAQLGLCLEHGNESVSSIADSFTVMAKKLREIKQLIPDIENDNIENNVAIINSKCNSLSDKVDGAIMAFQFYDRLCQNLTHVRENLSSLGDMVTEKTKFESISEWDYLQSEIRSRYTMREEREMFDLIHKGASAKKAMDMIRKNEIEQETDKGDIELF